MSLYNHVPSKEALLDGVVEAVLADVDLSTATSGRWDDRIRAQAAAFRVQQRIDEVTMSGDPTLVGAAPYLAVCDHDAEFWYGIELLIAGLANQIGGCGTKGARPPAAHHDRRTA
jgi:hypothetical protein